MEKIVVSFRAECLFAQKYARRLHIGVECDENEDSNELFRLDSNPKPHGREWIQAIPFQDLLENRGFHPSERSLLAVWLSYAILHFFSTTA